MKPLEGRDSALAALRQRLDLACAGNGQLVLLSGDAGIGKSALAARLADEADARGCAVTVGRAWEYADAPPYFPLRPCLRALDLDVPATDASAFALWDAVLAALARAALARPQVWILEDLHAADLQTLDLLTFLLPSLRGVAALVLATARDRDPRTSERVAQRLARMARDGGALHLGPLDLDATRRLASQVRGRPLEDAEAAALFARTGGVALFVVECARAESAMPPSVRLAAMERVEHLPDATRHSLAAGAVLGRDFSAGLVARVTDALPARVIEWLTPALRGGLITELRPGQFSFAHALVRDAVEDALDEAERARLHARAADALDGIDETLDVLLERTRHALSSLSLGASDETAALVARTVAAMERAGAHDRALAVMERVVEARAQGLWAAPWSARDTLRVARIAEAAGAHETSLARCRAVIDEARARSDGPLLAEAALLYGATLRPAVVDPCLVRALDDAAALCAGRDARLECLLLARRAAALQPAKDPAIPVQMARDAIDRARALADPSTLLEVLHHAGAAFVDYAPIEERLRTAEELYALAEARGDLPKQLRALARRALDLVELGRWADFDRTVDRMLEGSSRDGHPRHRWRPLLFASMRAVARGDLATSDALIAEVEQLRALTDDPTLDLSLNAHRLLRACALHQTAALRSAVSRLDALTAATAQASTLGVLLRALVFATLRDLAQTRAELARLDAHLDALLDDGSLVGWLALPIALVGTDDQRRRALARIDVDARPDHVGGHVPMSYEGPARRTAALLLASLGAHDRAAALLREALVQTETRGLLPWRARVLADLAATRRAQGHADEARALVATARALAAELGMDGLVSELDATDERDAPTPPPERARGTFTLAREGDVYRLALSGRAITVRDSRGMQLLERLVARRGEELHVLTLASDEGTPLAETDAGPQLDDRAVRQYRARVEALDDALAEAERNADLGRAERARRERDQIEAELLRAVGLGGSVRSAGSASERARVNVQRRIRDAIARVRAVDPAIARYLEQSVRTGTWCRFGAADG